MTEVERIRGTAAKRHAIERDIEDRLAAVLTPRSDGMDTTSSYARISQFLAAELAERIS
jgi:hypothetical protein